MQAFFRAEDQHRRWLMADQIVAIQQALTGEDVAAYVRNLRGE